MIYLDSSAIVKLARQGAGTDVLRARIASNAAAEPRRDPHRDRRLGSAVDWSVAYDQRLAQAANARGLPVVSPN